MQISTKTAIREFFCVLASALKRTDVLTRFSRAPVSAGNARLSAGEHG